MLPRQGSSHPGIPISTNLTQKSTSAGTRLARIEVPISPKPTSGPWRGLHSGEDAFLKWVTSESPVIQKEL